MTNKQITNEQIKKSPFISNIVRFFCFERNIKCTVYASIIFLLIILFCISCYNTDRLIRFHEDDTDIKFGVNIAIECILILAGIFLLMIFFRNKFDKFDICFCGHIAIFLILTGITTMISTAKRIELIR